MKEIHYHQQGDIEYCHAEEEVPDMFNFRQWAFDNNHKEIHIKGQDHPCYSVKAVERYLTSKGFQCFKVKADYGEREIRRQVHGLSKLEIMD